MIRRTIILLMFISLALSLPGVAQEPEPEPGETESAPMLETDESSFTFSPALGITVESISSDDEETFTAHWLAELQSKLYLDGATFQLGSSVYAKYGQLHSADAIPTKTTDDLIMSATPSMTIVPVAGLRLFLEVTGETQFAPGLVDSIETGFLDPLFLYQSLFFGKRFSWAAEDAAGSFDLTAGVGYALQQTFTEQFILEENRQFVITANSPLSSVQDQVTLESGYSAILDLNYRRDVATDLALRTSFKTVALTRESFENDLSKNVRVTSLLLVGVQYRLFSLDYSGHLVYDPSISMRRRLNQSLVFGLRVDL